MGCTIKTDNKMASFPIRAQFPSIDLLVTSNMEPSFGSTTHDPANFTVRVKNAATLSKVVKVVPKLVTIPRLFNNITDTNNTIAFFINGQWTGVTLIPGLYTHETVVDLLNAQLPPTLQLQYTDDSHIVPTTEFYSSPSLTSTVTVYSNSRIASALGWKNLTSVPQNLAVILPQNLSGNVLPMLGGPQCVEVTLSCTGPQLITANDGCQYNTLLVVPMTCDVGETAFFQSADLFVHDIDHSTPRSYSTIEVQLKDAWTGQSLKLPPSCTVSLLLKLYHVDTTRE